MFRINPKGSEFVLYLRRCLLLLSLALAAGAAVAAPDLESDEDYLPKVWKELEVELPAAPVESNLQSFYVSAAASNQFFVDMATLTVGSDGVVRYVLVILTPGGARNVTYEGMRCETRERRVYASGRADGTWSKARRNDWSRIRDEYVNRYHAALFLDYFCPGGLIVNSADEARSALRRTTVQVTP